MSDELTVGFIIAGVWCAIGVILGLLVGPYLRRHPTEPRDDEGRAEQQRLRVVEAHRARVLQAKGRERLARAGSCDTDALPRRSPLHEGRTEHPRTLNLPTDTRSST